MRAMGSGTQLPQHCVELTQCRDVSTYERKTVAVVGAVAGTGIKPRLPVLETGMLTKKSNF